MMGQLKMYMPLFATPATKGRPLGWQAESDWQEALKSMLETAGLSRVEYFNLSAGVVAVHRGWRD
jgi:ubiquinone/menaquinone biosynthesis C-methylase UbiE